MIALISLLFIAMIPIDFKLQIFPYTCLFTNFFVPILILVNSQALFQKKE